MTTRAGKTSASKKAAVKRKAAPARRKPRKRVPSVALQEMMAADIRRASLRMSVLFFGLGSILTSSVLGGALVWFTVIAYHKQDDRVARLAIYAASIKTSLRPRVYANERELRRLTDRIKHRWTVYNMAELCRLNEELNKKIRFRCANPFEISPSNGAQPPPSLREKVGVKKQKGTS